MSPYKRHTPADAVAALDQLGEAVAEYRRRSDEIARELAEAVHVALHAGATWGEVGARLGMSKQAARQHWSSYIQGMVAERDHQIRAAAGSLAAGQSPASQPRATRAESAGQSPAAPTESAGQSPASQPRATRAESAGQSPAAPAEPSPAPAEPSPAPAEPTGEPAEPPEK